MKNSTFTSRVLHLAIPLSATLCLSLPALADPDPVTEVVGADATGYANKTTAIKYSLAGECSLPCCPADPTQQVASCGDLPELTNQYTIVATKSGKFSSGLAQLVKYISGINLEGTTNTQNTLVNGTKTPPFKFTEIHKGFQEVVFIREISVSYEEFRHTANESQSAKNAPSTVIKAYKSSQTMALNQTFNPDTNTASPEPSLCP